MKAFSIIFISMFLYMGCTVEWSEKEKAKIKTDCLLGAARYGFTDAEKHCDCVVRTILNRYPSPNQFENMEIGEFGAIVSECQGRELSTRIIWPENTQKAFIDSCISMAKGQKNEKPEVYCHCVLDEIIRRYPTDDSIAGFNPKEMAEIGIGCSKIEKED